MTLPSKREAMKFHLFIAAGHIIRHSGPSDTGTLTCDLTGMTQAHNQLVT